MSYQALLFCPDEKTARVVTQVLSDLEFSVEACSEPFAAVKKLMAQHFDAIVVDCDNEQNATLLFKSARNSGSNQSALAVAVVEGQSGVAKAFRIGANLVLTKPINVEQSKGTLRVARGLLRKADSNKPASVSSPITTSPARPATPVATTAFKGASPKVLTPPVTGKPAFGGFAAQRASSENAISEATSSAFELQQDPTPAPEPTEAALLESMSDSINKQSSAASNSSKEYPWQPVSKPLAEPMASALKRAAEAASKPEGATSSSIRLASPQSSPADAARLRPAAYSMPSAHGAASAPAPAREIARLEVPAVESNLAAKVPPAEIEETETALPGVFAAAETSEEPLLFSAMDRKEKASGGSKKIFAIAAVAMITIAGAYYYVSEHSENAPAFVQKFVNKPAAPAPAQNQIPVQSHAPASVQPAVSAPTIGTPSSQASDSETTSPQVESTETGAVAPRPVLEAKPSAGKTTSTVTPNTKPGNSAPAPENKILTVAKPAPGVKSSAADSENVPPPNPSALGVGSGIADQEIAGIASSAGATMPKVATSGAIKISQGVTQGLLIKKVDPNYPQSAKQMHIQGTVQLEANIGKNGGVTNVKSLSGDAGLARAAIDAVKQWKYKPYTLNGEPVEIQTQITVNFKLP
jgi:TonB family protein